MCKYKKKLELIMTAMILIVSFYIGKYSAVMVQTTKVVGTEDAEKERKLENRCIVIDCGHGGIDSGKVGINGAMEKEINLAIGKKLQKILEDKGAVAVMTRESDVGLYDENESNKKQQDMKRRVQIMNDSKADIAISIHQNSYTQEYVNGPQVFYYETSAEAKELAECIQQCLNTRLQVERPRLIKGNTTYYVLCKTRIPTVIVECGFLSNGEEAGKLVDSVYQQQTAEAILEGIIKYFEE